jgi:hypothetical protein
LFPKVTKWLNVWSQLALGILLLPLQKPSDAPFTPEPTLNMKEYEHILSVISNMVVVMERSPRAFSGMSEEDLRQHFLVQLNGQVG